MHDDEDLDPDEASGMEPILSTTGSDPSLYSAAVVSSTEPPVVESTRMFSTTNVEVTVESSVSPTQIPGNYSSSTIAQRVSVYDGKVISSMEPALSSDELESTPFWTMGAESMFSYYVIVGILVLLLLVLAIAIVIGILKKEQLLKKQENVAKLLGQLEHEQTVLKQRQIGSFECPACVDTMKNSPTSSNQCEIEMKEFPDKDGPTLQNQLAHD